MAEASHHSEPHPQWPSYDNPPVRINDWLQSWEDGTLGALQDKETDPFLVEHFDRLSKGRQHLKILVPLCGTCIDMKWFADGGHHVVGVDVSEVAARLFFQHHTIQYNIHNVKHGKMYESVDGAIKFYVVDFFLFNESYEDCFDVVWDTGSLGTIHKTERERYISVMNRVMKAKCLYLLEIVVYDRGKFTGPPYCFHEEDVKEIFGNEFAVVKVAEHDVDIPEEDADIGENFREIGFRFHIYSLTRDLLE